MPIPQAAEVTQRLDSFVQNVPGVAHAVVASADGMLVAASRGVHRDSAERLAAVIVALMGVANAAARDLDGDEATQTVVEMGRGYLIATATSRGSYVAAHATVAADLGRVGYEMVKVVGDVDQVLAATASHPVRC